MIKIENRVSATPVRSDDFSQNQNRICDAIAIGNISTDSLARKPIQYQQYDSRFNHHSANDPSCNIQSNNNYGQNGQYGNNNQGHPGQYNSNNYGQNNQYGNNNQGHPGQYNNNNYGQNSQYGNNNQGQYNSNGQSTSQNPYVQNSPFRNTSGGSQNNTASNNQQNTSGNRYGMPNQSNAPAQPNQNAAPPSRSAAPTPPAQPAVPKRKRLPLPAANKLLKKGEKYSISKNHPGVNRLRVGIGWDMAVPVEYDMDLEAFLLNETEKVPDDSWIVYYGQLRSPDASVIHRGEADSGNDFGPDCEQIDVSLNNVSRQISKIAFVLTINEAKKNRYNFSGIKNAYIRITDISSGKELFRYELTDYYREVVSMVVGEMYMRNGEWKFNPVGMGTDDDLEGLCNRYGIEVSD